MTDPHRGEKNEDAPFSKEPARMSGNSDAPMAHDRRCANCAHPELSHPHQLDPEVARRQSCNEPGCECHKFVEPASADARI